MTATFMNPVAIHERSRGQSRLYWFRLKSSSWGDSESHRKAPWSPCHRERNRISNIASLDAFGNMLALRANRNYCESFLLCVAYLVLLEAAQVSEANVVYHYFNQSGAYALEVG
jgi:hypothetical protein